MKLSAGEGMRKFISSETSKLVKAEDRESFSEELLEDLKEIDEIRIAALGITVDQLKVWLSCQKE